LNKRKFLDDNLKISINTFEKAERLSHLIKLEKKEVTDKLESLINEYREILKE